jgi:hypothetical protein
MGPSFHFLTSSEALVVFASLNSSYSVKTLLLMRHGNCYIGFIPEMAALIFGCRRLN